MRGSNHRCSLWCFPFASHGGSMRLTKDTIKALAADPGDGEKLVFDDLVPGFGARRRSMGGSVSLFFQYRSGKKQRRLSLGRASATDLTKARKTAGDMYAQVRLG